MRPTIATLVLLVALSSGAAAQPLPNESEVRDSLARQWAKYVGAALAKNPDALVAIWTPGMRLLSDPGGAEDIRSSTQYRELAAAAFKSLTVVSLNIDPDEVTVVSPTTALEVGKWSEAFTLQGQEKVIKIYGAYMGLWQRQADGTWLLSRFIRNRHDFANPLLEEPLSRGR